MLVPMLLPRCARVAKIPNAFEQVLLVAQRRTAHDVQMRSPERADFVVKVRDATRRDARRRACRFVRNRPAAAANANAD